MTIQCDFTIWFVRDYGFALPTLETEMLIISTQQREFKVYKK